MSINSEIERISNNVSDALAATAEMGASVPATASSNDLGTLIRSIPKGGGATAWDDITDKPFSVVGGKEKIDQSCLPDGYPYVTVREDYILEECQPIFSEDAGGFVGGTVLSVLKDGLNCTVNWNGTNYQCVMTETEDMYVLGNFGVLFEDESKMTDHPFVIAATSAAMAAETGLAFLAIPLDGSTSLNLSISAEIPSYGKLDNNYLDLDWIPKSTGQVDTGNSVVCYINAGNQAADIDTGYIYCLWALFRSGSIEVEVESGEEMTSFTLKRNYAFEHSMAGDAYFGNLAVADPALPDTGEPLLVVVNPRSDRFGLAGGVMMKTPVEENTIVTIYPMPTSEPMPSNMLPLQSGLFFYTGEYDGDGHPSYMSIRYREVGTQKYLAVYHSGDDKRYQIPLVEF